MSIATQMFMKQIGNDKSSLTVNSFGGAIIDFHLNELEINPLSFRFTQDQMPLNNQGGAPYQGHFLCLGRWGEPSAGEKKAGIPDHGQFANMMWSCTLADRGTLNMGTESSLEGLKIERTIQIDTCLPLYKVTETVTNINPLGRLYNMVQHPTLAAPFLNHNTKIQCNALKGFHYKHYVDPEKYAAHWPYGIGENKTITDLRSCENGVSSVFSFMVDDNSAFGWIAAHSPDSQLLIGYLWMRADFPWINVWKDWDNGKIKYCGLEFGTTGLHQPFAEILKLDQYKVFNNSTFSYLDAGDAVRRRYISFLIQTPNDFGEIESVYIHRGSLCIKQKEKDVLMQMSSELINSW